MIGPDESPMRATIRVGQVIIGVRVDDECEVDSIVDRERFAVEKMADAENGMMLAGIDRLMARVQEWVATRE